MPREWGLIKVLAALFALALAGAVQAQPDLQDLSYGPDPRHRLDVYLPRNPHNAPLIMMVHGGGWRFGDKSNAPVWRNKASHWTEQGAIVVTVNYRLLPQADPLEQARDVARALAFVQSKGPSWGGTPQRVALIGHSAGGHLVALLSADPALAWDQGAGSWLASVTLDSAALDAEDIMTRTPSRLYEQAFGLDPSYWEKVSPLARLQPTAPPMLLVCSQKRLLPCPQARAFADALKAMGGRARILPLELSHRSINEAVGLHPAYTAELDAFLRDAGLWDTP